MNNGSTFEKLHLVFQNVRPQVHQFTASKLFYRPSFPPESRAYRIKHPPHTHTSRRASICANSVFEKQGDFSPKHPFKKQHGMTAGKLCTLSASDNIYLVETTLSTVLSVTRVKLAPRPGWLPTSWRPDLEAREHRA